MPDLPADRPIPDTDDLRLLAELINNAYIPLANAAWNARMTQQEAALRLVSMAERGLPLRMVADGDRQALWRIAQAGPATSGVPVTGDPARPGAPMAVSPGSVVGAGQAAPSPQAAQYGTPEASAYGSPQHPAEAAAAPAGPAAAGASGGVVSGPVQSGSMQSGPIQSGPIQSGPVPAGPAPSAGPSGPMPSVAAQLSTSPPIAVPPAVAQSGPAGAAPGFGAAPPVLPPASPVPPHEQAIAGAVPLGQPPFGQPDPTPQSAPTPMPGQAAPDRAPAAETGGVTESEAGEASGSSGISGTGGAEAATDTSGTLEEVAAADTSDAAGGDAPTGAAEGAPGAPDHSAGTPVDAGSLWGPAGSSAWARGDEGPEAGTAPEGSTGSDVGTAPDAGTPSGAHRAVDDGPAAPSPVTPGSATRHWAAQPVSGPAGEHLVVTILDVRDPGDAILTDAGYRMEPGQRAVLVHSSVANTGDVPYYLVGDLNLVLETDRQVLLGRANVAVASHPSFGVGVTPGRTADGWSVFLIPSETVLAGLKWCIRPDFPQTILSWPIAP